MLFREPLRIEAQLTDLAFGTLGRLYYRKYVSGLGLKETDHVIDYGSGTGVAATYIAKRLQNGRLTCVDLSKTWIEIARKRLKAFSNVECLQGEIWSLPLKDGSFDAITIHFVIHDIEEDERPPKVKALVNKLKAGGRIFIREPVREGHGISPEALDSLMAASGLKKISSKSGRNMLMGTVIDVVYERREEE